MYGLPPDHSDVFVSLPTELRHFQLGVNTGETNGWLRALQLMRTLKTGPETTPATASQQPLNLESEEATELGRRLLDSGAVKRERRALEIKLPRTSGEDDTRMTLQELAEYAGKALTKKWTVCNNCRHTAMILGAGVLEHYQNQSESEEFREQLRTKRAAEKAANAATTLQAAMRGRRVRKQSLLSRR